MMGLVGFILFLFACIDIGGLCFIAVLVYKSFDTMDGEVEDKDPYFAKEMKLIRFLSCWEAIMIGVTLMIIRWVIS